jgi:hypothetical protein
LIQQFHLDVFQRAYLAERDAEAARRVLDSERFHCTLRRLRVRLSA